MTQEHSHTTTDVWQELQQERTESERVRATNAELQRSINTAQSTVEIFERQLSDLAQAIIKHAPEPCVAAPVPFKVS